MLPYSARSSTVRSLIHLVRARTFSRFPKINSFGWRSFSSRERGSRHPDRRRPDQLAGRSAAGTQTLQSLNLAVWRKFPENEKPGRRLLQQSSLQGPGGVLLGLRRCAGHAARFGGGCLGCLDALG